MKFRNIDKRYLEERKKLSAKWGKREIWSVIDHWPLYCGIANLARFMAIAGIFKEVVKIPGHIAEFGSWRGANITAAEIDLSSEEVKFIYRSYEDAHVS